MPATGVFKGMGVDVSNMEPLSAGLRSYISLTGKKAVFAFPIFAFLAGRRQREVDREDRFPVERVCGEKLEARASIPALLCSPTFRRRSRAA